MAEAGTVTIYFDGLCPLCSREIDHYRKARGAHRLRFVDITSPQFDAASEGVDPHLVHKVMHVKGVDGRFHTGVDAFIHIWKTLPGYRWLAKVVRKKPIHRVAEIGYAGFARVRPYLPRKKREDCSQSPYCEMPKG